MKRKTGYFLVVLAVGFGCAAGAWRVRGQWLPSLAYWLDVGGAPQPADCVMVLPGDENVRPIVAASLVRQGLARRVLVPRTADSPLVEAGVLPPGAEVIRDMLRRCGVAEDDIVILPGSSDATFGDIEALTEFLASAPNTRVTIVTSAYHTRRVRWTVHRRLGPRAAQVALVSAPSDDFTPDTWWKCHEGFTAVVSEYLKLAYYLVTG